MKVHYGKILILRANVVHAGGFVTTEWGNLRCHFYVYKTPDGALHATHPANSYQFGIKGQEEELKAFYENCVIDGGSFV